MRIYAIAGSLRRNSVNKALLEVAQSCLSSQIQWSLCDLLAYIPLFNPDREDETPLSVQKFRQSLKKADGVMIASPEYAHGITGVLKNALDWVVGSGEFVDKPVALLNVSSRALHADASLREILSTMDADIIEKASVRFPITDNRMSKEELMSQPEIRDTLHTALSHFVKACEEKIKRC